MWGQWGAQWAEKFRWFSDELEGQFGDGRALDVKKRYLDLT